MEPSHFSPCFVCFEKAHFMWSWRSCVLFPCSVAFISLNLSEGEHWFGLFLEKNVRQTEQVLSKHCYRFSNTSRDRKGVCGAHVHARCQQWGWWEARCAPAASSPCTPRFWDASSQVVTAEAGSNLEGGCTAATFIIPETVFSVFTTYYTSQTNALSP